MDVQRNEAIRKELQHQDAGCSLKFGDFEQFGETKANRYAHDINHKPGLSPVVIEEQNGEVEWELDHISNSEKQKDGFEKRNLANGLIRNDFYEKEVNGNIAKEINNNVYGNVCIGPELVKIDVEYAEENVDYVEQDYGPTSQSKPLKLNILVLLSLYRYLQRVDLEVSLRNHNRHEHYDFSQNQH